MFGVEAINDNDDQQTQNLPTSNQPKYNAIS